jgi:hypothetical protein
LLERQVTWLRTTQDLVDEGGHLFEHPCQGGVPKMRILL